MNVSPYDDCGDKSAFSTTILRGRSQLETKHNLELNPFGGWTPSSVLYCTVQYSTVHWLLRLPLAENTTQNRNMVYKSGNISRKGVDASRWSWGIGKSRYLPRIIFTFPARPWIQSAKPRGNFYATKRIQGILILIIKEFKKLTRVKNTVPQIDPGQAILRDKRGRLHCYIQSDLDIAVPLVVVV